MTDHLSKMAEEVFGAVRSYIARASEGLAVRIKALEEKPLIPGPAGPAGTQGTDGADGLAGTDGKNGADGKDGAPGSAGVAGVQGEKGIDGRDGVQGDPGRDALQIDVLDGIDAQKRYQRGTFAHHRGGLIRSFRATDPVGPDGIEKSGWQVVVEGLAEIAVEGAGRGFTMKTVNTSGKTVEAAVTLPVMIYKDVFRDGAAYEHGDTVTFGGSTWHCNKTRTAERPGGPGADWTLAVKRGRDGKDADATTPTPAAPVRLK